MAFQLWPLSLYLTTLTLTSFSLFFFLKLFKKRLITYNLPPSPPSLPVIGNLHQLGSLPHRSLQTLSKKYGPIMLLHFGHAPTIVVSSEEMARDVMKTHDAIFASRPFSSIAKRLMYGSKDVAFAPYGEYWRQVKKICVIQLLSLKKVKSFESIRKEEVSLFINKIHESHKGLVNLSKMTTSLTNNITCRVTLGKRYFEGEKEGDDLRVMLDEFIYLLGSFPIRDFIPRLGWIDWLGGLDARVRKNFKDVNDFLDKAFDENRQASSDRGKEDSFVDVLLSLDETDGIAGKDNMKAIVLDMFAAGTETTFTVIEWAMSELIRNPKVMKISQEEVRQVVSCDGKITEESVYRMKYLRAIIRETLRLHPSVPLLVPRETLEDTKLQGFDIPARTRVIVNAWAIGRNPESWDRPEEFDPERFLNCDIDFLGQDFQLIPFGAGRRTCPGISFGVAIIELTLAHLLHNFDWELPNGMEGKELDMSESSGISVRRRSDLILVAKPHIS